MTGLRQVLVALAVIQWREDVKGAPLLQGVKITRNFDIDFKPFQFKPISLIWEKWGPFGAFGKKHAIAKRDADTVNITPSPLNVGSVVPPGLNTGMTSPLPTVGPAFANPAPVFEVSADNPPPPVNIPPISIPKVITPSPISNDIFQGPEVNPVPQVGSGIGPNFNSFPQFRSTGLNTDISRIQPNIQNISPMPVFDNTPFRVNLLVPPTPQTNVPVPAAQPAPDAPATPRGGVIARLFGEFILQLLSRLITSARSSFSQLSNTA